MQDLLSSLVTVATISPNKKDLDAGTVSSVVITGIVVVFIALILLIVSVSIYGSLFSAAAKKKAREEEEAKKASAAPETPAKAADVTDVSPAAPFIEDGIEEETVAVIMAAIACMSSSGAKKLVLKSVKTSKPQRSAWSSAGIVENTRPF